MKTFPILLAVLGVLALLCPARTTFPPENWSWIREDKSSWRLGENETALELRAQKGRIWAGTGAKNLFVEQSKADGRTASVIVTHDAPKTKYEQGGLLVYRDDDHFVKLINEFIDGEYYVVMAREVGEKRKVFVKIRTGLKSVRLRLSVEGDAVRAAFAEPGGTEFRGAGECELPGAGEARFALFTQDGSDEETRWIRFEQIVVTESGGGGAFETRQLSEEFHAEGAAMGDLNNDGRPDVVYGPFWFEGPTFHKRHLIYKPVPFAIRVYSNNFMPHVRDFDGDGWNDVLVLGFPGRAKATYWYRNPGEAEGLWEQHVVFRGPGNESPAFTDVDGDGKPEVVCSIDGRFCIVVPDPDDATKPWRMQAISPKGSTGGKFTHGLGIGDVDGDGRPDLLEKSGWWQQPEGEGHWKKHAYPFSGPGGAQMFAYDFDGDGDNDVITSLAAHAYGLAWFEQVRDAEGKIGFERHLIMGSKPGESDYGIAFSQLHGVELADVDGDGVKDLVTGKRYFAHNGNDPGGEDAPVIYWFRTVRGGSPGEVDFVPHLIDDASGVGTVVNSGDLNGDGMTDIVIGNKKGCFVHLSMLGRKAEPLARVGRAVKEEIEGETLQVLKKTGNPRSQGMTTFGAGVWSGDAQLWWIGAKPGDVLELAVPVEADGFYQVSAAMTKAVDYGIFELSLDGQKLGGAVDLYQPQGVSHTGEVPLGSMELKKGRHVFAAKILGAHPDAKRAYMFGLDFLKLTKVEAKAQTLFDGKSLKGWKGDAKWWRVENGGIVGEIAEGGKLGKNQFLYWDGELHDFDLSLKFRIGGHPSANSGVQIRCQEGADGHAAGYQADLDDGATWAGRIYDEHGRGLILERGTKVVIDEVGGREVTPFRDPKEYAALVKKDAWNDYRIRAVGPRIQVWLNGQPAADLTDHQVGQQDFSGKLALQLHSGPGPARITFKDITLTPLGKTELPKIKTDPYGSRAGISPEGKNLGFEEGTLEGWTTTGDVWKGSPIEGNTVTPRRPGQASVHDGKFWVGGYERTKSDAGTGTLTSAPFEVTHRWASFLVGAGPHPELRVELIDAKSGEVLYKRSGTRELEDMYPVTVDLAAHLGKSIRVRVVDEHTGHWGHINYDDFRFHAAKPTRRPARVKSNPLLKHLTPNPADEGAIDTVAGMWVPEGFKVDLIAKEPEITQPIAFTFDERGRMWIAEAHSYPRKRREGEGRDRIVILEDGDGDGSFETSKVFADGLNLVSGLEVGFGGVWVGAAPQLLFFPDKNRDDRPDGDPVVLLDGWGYQDTHETLNSFIWGPDGWLYGNQGVFCHSKIGKPGTPDNERKEMRAGVWRYHPQRHAFEIFAHGCSNQWGIDFDEMGHMFITHCRSAWGGGPTTYVVQNGHYWNQSNSHHAPFVSGGKPGWNPGPGEKVFRNYLLASARYGHGEGGAGKPGSRALYGGHSHVGTMIYLGSNWPREYRGKLFTHNLHGHQMNVQVNERRGSGFETVHAGRDHLFTADPRFIGVDLKCGPDGAVYMIDWYDRQHCHNNNVEVWDRSDGRIYRMAWTATYKPVKVDFRDKDHGELLELALSKDEWQSRMARRLLYEKGVLGVRWGGREEAKLLKLIASADSDPAAALRAMWALKALGKHADGWEEFLKAASHPDENVRYWAVRLRSEARIPALKLISYAADEASAMVRLAMASELPKLESSARWALAETLAARAEDRADGYLPKMIWFGIAPLVGEDPSRAMRMADTTPMPMLADSIVWFLAKDAAGREQLVKTLPTASAPRAERILALMAFALPNAGNIPAPPGWAALSKKLRRAETASALDKLGGLFGDASVLEKMRATVADRSKPMPERRKAFDFLKSSGDADWARECIALIEEDAFRPDLYALLGRFNNRAVGEAALARFPQLKTPGRNALLASLSAQPELARVLLESIRDKRTDLAVLTSLHIRQMSNLGDEAVSALLAEAGVKLNTSNEAAVASIAKYQKLYKEAPLWSYDRKAGEAVFAKLCATCHKMNGKGLNMGPDLTGSHTNGVDYFIENIVDPNAVIGETFQLNIITKKDGTVLSGMPANETDAILTVRTLTESVEVPKDQIKSRQVLQQSMMPPALLDTVSEKEAIELLKFLTTK